MIHLKDEADEITKMASEGKLIIEIAKKALQAQNEEAMGNALKNRAANLQYEQAVTMKNMREYSDSVIERITVQREHLVNQTWKQVADCEKDTERMKQMNADKLDFLKTTFNEDLRQIRNSQEMLIASLEREQDEKYERLVRDLDLKERIEIMREEEESGMHLRARRETHAQSITDMIAYHDDIINENTSIISKLHQDIEIAAQSSRSLKQHITNLRAENSKSGRPFEDMKIRHAALLVDLEKTNRGRMTLRNFRKSTELTGNRLLQVERDIEKRERDLSRIHVSTNTPCAVRECNIPNSS